MCEASLSSIFSLFIEATGYLLWCEFGQKPIHPCINILPFVVLYPQVSTHLIRLVDKYDTPVPLNPCNYCAGELPLTPTTQHLLR